MSDGWSAEAILRARIVCKRQAIVAICDEALPKAEERASQDIERVLTTPALGDVTAEEREAWMAVWTGIYVAAFSAGISEAIKAVEGVK